MITEKRSISLQLKVFLGLIFVALVSISATTLISYLIIKNAAQIQNETSLQGKARVLFTSLDYAIEHSNARADNMREVLKYKIQEIADINKIDIVLYDMQGRFIVSNRDDNFILQKKIPKEVLKKILDHVNEGYDFKFYDEAQDATVTSSYRILQSSNSLDPMAIAYFPSYYNNNQFLDIFSKYMQFIILINLFAVLLSVFISWRISKNITKAISSISSKISQQGQDLKPIKYSNHDELSVLVRSYNRMIYQLREQTELKSQMEREIAWREMAKQVAHEVKNPLTPMKLTIQNFSRKFDKEDPKVESKLKNVTQILVEQIDLIAEVANAFSEFAKLPEKQDSILNLNEEIESVVRVFNNNDIFIHTNKPHIQVKFDKIYLTRIFTNLITNAQQASVYNRTSIINIDIEQLNKNKVSITVQDNGTGIPKEKLSKIFEPNFTTKSSGMGLGLTMVKKMIEEYQGSITVSSEEDRGTQFVILIPTGLDEEI